MGLALLLKELLRLQGRSKSGLWSGRVLGFGGLDTLGVIKPF